MPGRHPHWNIRRLLLLGLVGLTLVELYQIHMASIARANEARLYAEKAQRDAENIQRASAPWRRILDQTVRQADEFRRLATLSPGIKGKLIILRNQSPWSLGNELPGSHFPGPPLIQARFAEGLGGCVQDYPWQTCEQDQDELGQLWPRTPEAARTIIYLQTVQLYSDNYMITKGPDLGNNRTVSKLVSDCWFIYVPDKRYVANARRFEPEWPQSTERFTVFMDEKELVSQVRAFLLRLPRE